MRSVGHPWNDALKPFDFRWTGELAGFEDLRDRARAYGTFGGTSRYLEQIDAKQSLFANEALRYGVADPAFRFYQRFVEPNRSMLERYPADRVWTGSVRPALDRYMGREFERIVPQAWDIRAAAGELPLVRRWGRWEGTDRDGRSLEIDIVAELEDGRIMTGSIKWGNRPVGASLHENHIASLHRAAGVRQGWARRALEEDGVLLYVAAGGFTERFGEVIEREERNVRGWGMGEVYEKAQ